MNNREEALRHWILSRYPLVDVRSLLTVVPGLQHHDWDLMIEKDAIAGSFVALTRGGYELRVAYTLDMELEEDRLDIYVSQVPVLNGIFSEHEELYVARQHLRAQYQYNPLADMSDLDQLVEFMLLVFMNLRRLKEVPLWEDERLEFSLEDLMTVQHFNQFG